MRKPVLGVSNQVKLKLNEPRHEKTCLQVSDQVRLKLNGPRHEKTCLRGFRPGKTQTK